MNRLIIAAAGSGKTTFLVDEALRQNGQNVLITTYTEANESEIRTRILEKNNCIPSNITVQTWFSFLLQHGVRPFQGHLLEERVSGLAFVQSQSGYFLDSKTRKVFYNEANPRHFINKDSQIFSDKLSKFVIRCNMMSNGAIMERLGNLYKHVFIDEVQDLAGYDLEFIRLLFRNVGNVLLVGDPRQVTYLTHSERKYAGYRNGKIKEFILDHCKGLNCDIDEVSLNKSHRNNQAICDFSSQLYPHLSKCESDQELITGHDGVFLIDEKDAEAYLQAFKPLQLRYNSGVPVNQQYPAKNFGASKGLSFDRVLIYPTGPIKQYLRDGKLLKAVRIGKHKANAEREAPAFDIAKFYVAVTRARYSVGIVCDLADCVGVRGVTKFDATSFL